MTYQAKMHFYCEHDALLKETLQQLDFVSEINVQDDPNWDTYFDFLLASPLEMKLNATEEILSMLNSKGRNLSDTYLIEHTFHFDEEEKIINIGASIIVDRENLKKIIIGKNGKIICDATEIKIFLREPVKKEGLDKGWTMKYITDFAIPVDFYLRGEEYSAQIEYFVSCVENKKVGQYNTFDQAYLTDLTIEMIIENSKKN